MSNPRAVAKSNRTRIRTKVYCFCKECNGKLVDPRTKTKHGLKYNISYANNNFSNNYQEAEPSNANPSNNFGDDYQEAGPSDVGQYTDDNNAMECEPLLEMIPIHESAKHKFTKKGKISDHVLENLLPDNGRDMNDDQDRDFEDYDDENRDSESFEDDDEDGVSSDFEDDDEDSNFGDFESDEEYRDSEDFEDDDEEEVNFASKDFDDGEPKLPNINNDNYTWIILWILQYQQRYKLPNVSIDSLFKFLRFFLLTVDENKFSSFPSSLYVAKKILGISTNIIKYAACNKCHKLYDINEISNTTEVPTCSFINYPNHSIERFRQKCNNPLVKKIDSNKDGGNNPIIRPIMTFPLVNIRRQLTLFFGRKDFEVTCRKWAERENETEALFYIYDGRIWMSFEDGKGEPFFKKEYAKTHIRLMLNMDWFQPYINSQYSVGVIYAVICNLPRSERFKPYNILTLAVIPGPKEPKKHEINNYLYPIINQLNRLWEGYHIKTYEYNNGRFIRGAIIGCASDVPATRKLCGFISARIACYRCYKSANLVNNQPNFGGFEDIDDWFVERDINLIREKAREWKKCATEESRKAHVSQYHVRWSEVYQLPYFNSVRFCVVDPMHCLFLGVAKWIVMKLWIDEGILNNEKLKIMQERADLIKFPSDLGRHPVRIATGDGFSNFTADMWKTFERMNGILGSYKNSKRNIEPELLKIMVESSFLNYYLTNCDSNILNTTLDIIKPRKSAGSLAALDDFTSDEYQNFLRLSLIENESAYGTERFPGLLMKPRQETCLPNRVLDLLVEFYNSLYEEHFVPIYSITGPNNDIVVISKIIQYGRIRIGRIYLVPFRQLVMRNHHTY
ncbi:hypothetical protein GLOIN_2v1788017 [Rhizophagus irregularis DAOM 181602=DAOM 197198]|nr:hypothetical protein GLOIN_2v1788017 [Rhizophagus irregularis DAOM 181602=DAOM 197198]